MDPITRIEKILADIASGVQTTIEPVTRLEHFILAAAKGGTHDTVRLEFVYDDDTSAIYDFTATEVTTPDGDEGGGGE